MRHGNGDTGAVLHVRRFYNLVDVATRTQGVRVGKSGIVTGRP